MKSEIIEQLVNLGVSLPIALLVWRYYKRRTVTPSERYLTFGPRFWSGSVDSCVLWPLSFVTATLLSLSMPNFFAALLVMLESLAWVVYTVVMHARYGQTVGKMITKVRVVDFRTEGKISWRQAWLREGIPMVLSLGLLGWEIFHILTGKLDPRSLTGVETTTTDGAFWVLMALPGLWFLAEVVTMLTNKKMRALHDYIAGTVVVRTNAEDGVAQLGSAPNGGLSSPVGDSSVTERLPSGK